MKILVVGASGFLGKKAVEIFEKKHSVAGTSLLRSDYTFSRLDIANKEDVKKFLDEYNPDLVFNAAAVVDVDLCEQDKYKSWNVNVNGPLYLAELCSGKKIKLVVISSDYIFSGYNLSYKENDIAHPKSFYGFTKSIMEKTVLFVNPNALIIRLPIIYGYNNDGTGDKLVMPVIKSLREDKEVIIEDFRIKYPVLADDVIENAMRLIERNERGIFNFSSDKALTRFDMANVVANIFALDKKLIKNGKEKNFLLKPKEVKLINTKDKSLKFVSFKEGVEIINKQMSMYRKGFNITP